MARELTRHHPELSRPDRKLTVRRDDALLSAYRQPAAGEARR